MSKTFKDAALLYQTMRPRLSRARRAGLGMLIEVMGGEPIATIDPDVLGRWLATREGKGGGAVKAATVIFYTEIFHAVRTMAWKQGWCERPMPAPKPPRDEPRRRWLSEDEIERLLLASSEWLWPMLVFLLNTGLRPGELGKMDWRDVKTEADGSLSVVVGSRKGRGVIKYRRVPLNPRAVAALVEALRVSGRPATKLTSMQARGGQVFFMPMGGRFNADSVAHAYKATVAKLPGLEDTTIYDLRRTFGSRLANAGVDLRQIADLLGHEDVNLTRTTYAHLLPARHREAVIVGMV